MISDAASRSPDELGTPGEVAEYLHTTEGRLAQMRYLGTGPKYVKVGRRVLYRWTDIEEYLHANTHQ